MKNNILMVIIIGLVIGCGGEKIDVTVMTPTIQCGMCERNIEVGLAKVDGVASSTVDLSTKTTKVSFDAQKTDLLKIEKAIYNLGYQANAWTSKRLRLRHGGRCAELRKPTTIRCAHRHHGQP